MSSFNYLFGYDYFSYKFIFFYFIFKINKNLKKLFVNFEALSKFKIITFRCNLCYLCLRTSVTLAPIFPNHHFHISSNHLYFSHTHSLSNLLSLSNNVSSCRHAIHPNHPPQFWIYTWQSSEALKASIFCFQSVPTKREQLF